MTLHLFLTTPHSPPPSCRSLSYHVVWSHRIIVFPIQGLPPAINDVPDKKSQVQNSQTNVQFSSSSNDPNNNQLPPEAFQNPFNNPSSPFSRRTDQFESNPAFVGTSLFSEGFLDSPDRVISAGPKQRGPDAVDIGGYQIFPGFQQFEKTGKV